jgi:hypothetical protein
MKGRPKSSEGCESRTKERLVEVQGSGSREGGRMNVPGRCD